MNPIGKLDRKKMVLLVAVIFGVSGAIGANYYLNRTINEIKRQESVTASVVVAKSELPAGSMITSDTVSVREIPLEWAQSGAVKPENFESIENATLKEPMGKGEMVMWSMVEKVGDQAVSAVVVKGRRAVTVPVDEISSLSGMLQPGDLIDLVVTVNNGDQAISFPLLQQVRVIATGSRMRAITEEDGGAQYSTITVDVTPEEARKIIAARDGGQLTAMLRNPGDRQPIGAYRLGMNDLLGSSPAPAKLGGAKVANPAATVQGVRIIYGDQL